MENIAVLSYQQKSSSTIIKPDYNYFMITLPISFQKNQRFSSQMPASYAMIFILGLFASSCTANKSKDGLFSDPIVCEQPEELSYSLQLTDVLIGHPFPDEYHENGPMASVFDMDKDGTPELLYCFPEDHATYLYQRGELTTLINACGQLLVTDIDNDGWLDLAVSKKDLTNRTNNRAIELWKNTNGTLSPFSSFEIGEDALIGLRSGDFNNDGFTDLLLVRNHPDDLEKMQDTIAMWIDDWTYEINDQLLPHQFSRRNSFDAAILDINLDGWADIYVGTDQGRDYGGNVLWWNRGGTFEAASEECGCTPTQSSMGIDIADFDHDGLYDILSSDSDQTHLLKGLSLEEFVDVSAVMNSNVMEDFEMTWGVRLTDLDNDGSVELLQTQGDLSYQHMLEEQYKGPMAFSVATQVDGQFVEIQDDIGLTAQGSFRSVIPFHWNDDGVLDLFITDEDQAPILYVSNNCTANNYISFTGSEGTKVRFTGGGQSFIGELHSASSFSASQEPLLHFGLGDLDVIENVEVQYRGGDWITLTSSVQVPQQVTLPYSE